MRASEIDHLRLTATTARHRGTKVSGSADFARHLRGTDIAAADETESFAGPSALGALLDIQEIDADEPRRRRRAAAQYGAALLDRLERLRIDILAGRVPTANLAALAQVLRSERQRSQEPHLDSLLEEIELRAQVEIAKLSPAA